MTTTETSTELHAQAEQIRAQAAQLRAEGQDVLAQAQAEADRLRAEADRVLVEGRNKSARLNGEASNVERSAEPIQQRAMLLQAAEELVTAIPAAEQRVVTLYSEAESLGEQIESLATRLDKLGEDREEIAVELAKARQVGDVDGVVTARTRMQAVDEVVTELTGQQRAAQERVIAIGAPDDGAELGKAAELVVRMHAQQRAVLNQLDPTRPEAVADALLEQLQEFASAQVELAQEQKNQPARRTTVIRN